MLTCQYVLWKTENTESRVIRKCVSVCGSLAHMTSKINKSSRSLMKVQPPAESFHQELSRLSLGICVNVCICVCESVCLCICGVCFHTRQEGKPHYYYCFIAQLLLLDKVRSFSTPLKHHSYWRAMMTTWTKENTMRGDTLSEWTASLFLQELSQPKTHDGAKSCSLFSELILCENSRNVPSGFSVCCHKA